MDQRAMLIEKFIAAHLVPLALLSLVALSLGSKDFRRFISAVTEHWITLMAGGAGLIATIVAQIRGADVSFSDYVAIALFTVVWACFLAWRKERERATSTQRPDFVPTIAASIGQGPSEETTNLFIQVTIVNRGSPSIARG
jgi:hypothetical protein